MRLGALLAFALALGIVPVPVEASVKAGSTSRLVRGKGIFLLVKSTLAGISISRVGGARKPTASANASFPSKDWERHPPGSEELIVSLHDKRGRLLGDFAFPVRRIAFADTLRPKSAELSGGPRALASVELSVHVPYLRKAAFLYFWRAVIRPRAAAGAPLPIRRGWEIEGNGPYGPVVFAIEPLGAYPLNDHWQDIEKVAFPKTSFHLGQIPRVIFEPSDLLFIVGTMFTSGTPSPPSPPPPPPTCPDTTFLVTPSGAGAPPATSFNIVILGDGFKSTEMTTFHNKATEVKDELLGSATPFKPGTAPFNGFTTKINVYEIQTPSTNSGVDHCPNDCVVYPECPCPSGTDPKTTALEVSGDVSDVGSCTEFIADFSRIKDVAACALDPADVDLIIVLVNCNAYGGMTYPTERTIFVATGHAKEIIAHEAGHALAPIGEEYMAVVPCPAPSCTVCAPPVEFINVALPADVASNTVSWFPLATTSERTGATFTKVEHQSSSPCYGDSGGQSTGASQKLGLYWGAQYLTDGPDLFEPCSDCQGCRVTDQGQCVTLCGDLYCDPRAAAFYRPMPYCKMRYPDEPYCRVCYCALRAALAISTGLTTPPLNGCPADVIPPGNVTDLHRSDEHP